MKMRCVVTFKDDGSLKARLVVQGFTDQRLSSPTASRRSRQIFLTLAASLGFQTHKGDVKCAFLQRDLDEQRVDDDVNFKIESEQPVSAQITLTYDKHTGTRSGFEISFTEYVNEISIITLPSHRRRDKKSKIAPLEHSQLRALDGQLLWLGLQMFATVAGASVTVDGTNTTSHGGHDL